MKLLQRYLLHQFLPVCIVALLFFILMLELGDLFANLWKYLQNDVAPLDVLRIMWFYIPKCISFSMPLAVLFASSYIIGNMYARNELTSIFASGFPLHFLVLPLLILGFILSVSMFFYEDRIVINSVIKKNALTKILLKQEDSLSNTNIVVLSNNGELIYIADYYQDTDKKLYSFLGLVRDTDGNLMSIIQAPVAKWNQNHWDLEDYITYLLDDPSRVIVTTSSIPVVFDESPETFRKNITSVDELAASDAKIYINGLKKAGLPYAEHLSNYYKRFSFPFTIFIVLFFSISLGGRFKKNIMLMSLLLSLSIAVLFYVTQMVTMLFAKWEYVSPFVGAWFPIFIFFIASSLILKFART